MSISNGIISAPISVNDPYDLLGVPKQYNGWDIAYIGRNKHGRINKWSKYKPVKWADYFNGNYKGTNGMCGFNAMAFVGNEPYEHYKNGTAWTYEPPTGGDKEPYRITDWNNYYHYAKPFVYSGILKGTVIEYNRALETGMRNITIQMKKTSTNEVVFSDLGHSISFTKAKFACTVYSDNPLEASKPNRINTIQFSKLINDIADGEYVQIPVDVFTTQYSTLYAIITICPNFDAPLLSHMPIPYDDDNYFMVRYNIVDRPFGYIEFGFRTFSFGNSANLLFQPMREPNYYYPPTADRQFLAIDRGSFVVNYAVSNNDWVNTETVYLNNSSFYAETKKIKEKGRVIKVDDATPPATNQITLKPRETKILTVEYGIAEFFYYTDFNDNINVGKVTQVTFSLVNNNGFKLEVPVNLYLVRKGI